MTDLLDAALAYAARGWPVFPCRPRGKPPVTANGLHDATTDTERIRAWWSDMPDANVAVSPGPAGLLVIDVDGSTGYRTLIDLEAEHGHLPDTLVCWTPGGDGVGFHAYYCGEAPSSVGLLGPGIDVRSRGGYVIVPPSVHPNGEPYLWPTPDVSVAAAPLWLVELCQVPRVIEPTTPRPAGTTPKAVVLAALRDEAYAVARAHEGTRNDRLFEAAFTLSRFVTNGSLPLSAWEEVLYAAAREAGLPDRETKATLKSALDRRGIAA